MKYSSRDGFTLVEVLVVIAIIAVLAGLLMPFIARAREKADQGRCVGNLRSTYAGARLYSADHDGDLVPAFIRNEDGTNQWPILLVKYFSENNNNNSDKWACPSYHKDEGTSWDWGYGVNESIRWEGDGTSNKDQNFNTRIRIDENGEVSGEYVKWVNITHQSGRLFFCESSEWHINGKNLGYAVYDRHGSSKNVSMFFDGHIEMLTPMGIETSIRDPENFINQEQEPAVN